MHARNKPIPRDNNDALLHQVAELAIGYSGAELANLLNEAAILMVGGPWAWACCCLYPPSAKDGQGVGMVWVSWGAAPATADTTVCSSQLSTPASLPIPPAAGAAGEE